MTNLLILFSNLSKRFFGVSAGSDGAASVTEEG